MTCASRLQLAEVPALVVRPASTPLGAVLFLHGLSASKEANEAELHRFAERGLCAFGIDAPGHGARRGDGALTALEHAGDGPARHAAFLELVRRSAAELPAILRAASQHSALPVSRVGICGVSFGGFTGYAGLSNALRPGALVAMLGAPDCAEPERFFPTPVQSITAERDERVNPGPTRAMHQRLAAAYASAPERLRYVELPGEQHFMSMDAWLRAQSLAGDFLLRFLGA